MLRLVRRRAVTLVVQVNGKVRDRIEVDPAIDQAEAESLALASPRIQEQLAGETPARVVSRRVTGDDPGDQRLETHIPAELGCINLAVSHDYPAEVARAAQPPDREV